MAAPSRPAHAAPSTPRNRRRRYAIAGVIVLVVGAVVAAALIVATGLSTARAGSTAGTYADCNTPLVTVVGGNSGSALHPAPKVEMVWPTINASTEAGDAIDPTRTVTHTRAGTISSWSLNPLALSKVLVARYSVKLADGRCAVHNLALRLGPSRYSLGNYAGSVLMPVLTTGSIKEPIVWADIKLALVN